MALLTVHHRTTYSYARPVKLGQHQLLFRPRDSFDQWLLKAKLKVTPEPARIRWIHDVFGNCITLVDFEGETRELAFETEIKVDHHPEDTPDFEIEDYARQHPFAYSAEELPDLLPYVTMTLPDPSLDVWLARFIDRNASLPTGQLLMTLNEAIAESFSYARRTAPGTQTPAETLQLQRGTCRDFALLMMECARSLGFAARFVTGYVYVPSRDGPVRLGGGSTHAWCQIYVPGSGWVEFDPTNGIVGSRDLVRVAVARTPLQAIPLSGTYWGTQSDDLGMSVEVNVKMPDGKD
jgi:transglutaminase-like putative cysteine protease